MGPRAPYCIDLIDEDDCGSTFTGKHEKFPDKPGAFTDKFVNKFATGHADECCMCFMSYCFRYQGFTGTGRTIEQDAFWGFNTNTLKNFWFGERVLDCFPDFLYHFSQTADLSVACFR